MKLIDKAAVVAEIERRKQVAFGWMETAPNDAIEAEFSFDTEGVSKTDKGQVVKTKLEKGADYGMAKDGAYDANQDGVVKEWYEQAAAFDAACVGKDAKGIAALEGEGGLGVEDLQTAGCTIAITNMVAAAVKAATVA